jgi:hypothetical protein
MTVSDPRNVRINSDNDSYTAYPLTQSVSPPTAGDFTMLRSEPIGGSAVNGASKCQMSGAPVVGDELRHLGEPVDLRTQRVHRDRPEPRRHLEQRSRIEELAGYEHHVVVRSAACRAVNAASSNPAVRSRPRSCADVPCELMHLDRRARHRYTTTPMAGVAAPSTTRLAPAM